jgi:hypothetical protein
MKAAVMAAAFDGGSSDMRTILLIQGANMAYLGKRQTRALRHHDRG